MRLLSHCLHLIASLIFNMTFISLSLAAITYTSCSFPSFTCWLPVSRARGVKPPHSAPEGSSAMWQHENEIFLGGTLGCEVQRLVDAWQLACSTAALLRPDNTTTANILFIESSHTMDAKIEEKSSTLSLPISTKMFYQLIMMGVVHVRIFLNYEGRIRAYETVGRIKLVHPCLFHIRDSEHN